MTKRTNTTRTTIYRRHADSCSIKDQPLNLAGCECPLWLHGKIRGKLIRVSLDTRKVSTAEMKQSRMEAGHDDEPTPGGGPQLVGAAKDEPTLEYATAEFLKAKAHKRSNSVALYTRATKDFNAWAERQDIVLLREVTTLHMHQYFAAHPEWKGSTAHTKLTHLRVFFNWCFGTMRWLPFAPTDDKNLSRDNKKRGGVKRTPFSPAEVTRIFAAIELMDEDKRDATRALLYLLLYTGMRISDATFCERASLTKDGNVDYYVIKTGKVIDLPPMLLQPAVDALAKLPPSRVYFFQPDMEGDYLEARLALRAGEEFSIQMPGYDARMRVTTALVEDVLKLAGIKGSCHSFRDTFAINMLVGGADIYAVSKMLGHSDIKITDQHYMKLVPGYRERMSKMTRVLAYQFPQAS